MKTLEEVKDLFGTSKVLKKVYVPLAGSNLKRIYDICKPQATPTVAEMRSLIKRFREIPIKGAVRQTYDTRYIVVSNCEDREVEYASIVLDDAFQILDEAKYKDWKLSEKGCDFMTDLATFLRFSTYEELTEFPYYQQYRKEDENWICIGFPILNAMFEERNRWFSLSFTIVSNTENFPSLELIYDKIRNGVTFGMTKNYGSPEWKLLAEEFAETIRNL